MISIAVVLAFSALAVAGGNAAEKRRDLGWKSAQKNQGKFVQTPFGPARVVAEPRKPPSLLEDTMLTVEQQAETAVFRRKTPFGVQIWKKPLTELDDVERHLLKRGHGIDSGGKIHDDASLTPFDSNPAEEAKEGRDQQKGTHLGEDLVILE